jgi:hypothetical protein
MAKSDRIFAIHARVESKGTSASPTLSDCSFSINSERERSIVGRCWRSTKKRNAVSRKSAEVPLARTSSSNAASVPCSVRRRNASIWQCISTGSRTVLINAARIESDHRCESRTNPTTPARALGDCGWSSIVSTRRRAPELRPTRTA